MNEERCLFGFVFGVMGLTFGLSIGTYIRDDMWCNRLVDNPEGVSAIRSAVLAERAAQAQSDAAVETLNRNP